VAGRAFGRFGVRAALLAAVLGACSSNGTGNTNPGAQDTIFAFAGDSQTVLGNTYAPVAPTVKITTSNGQPVAGVPVNYMSHTRGASPADTVVETGADGTAAVPSWKVFYAGTAELQATAADARGSPVTFVTTVLGYVQVQPANGSNMQQAPAATAVAIPPMVSLFSPNDEVLPGLRVVFRVISGGGTITGDTAIVNAVGVATVGSWTLGPTPGLNQLRAVVLQPLGGDSTTITATGT
jgi:hypothetical protein